MLIQSYSQPSVLRQLDARLKITESLGDAGAEASHRCLALSAPFQEGAVPAETDLTLAGKMAVRVPKLKGAVFESVVIERYRRREESVERRRHVSGGCLHPSGRRHQPG